MEATDSLPTKDHQVANSVPTRAPEANTQEVRILVDLAVVNLVANSVRVQASSVETGVKMEYLEANHIIEPGLVLAKVLRLKNRRNFRRICKALLVIKAKGATRVIPKVATAKDMAKAVR